MQRSIVRLRGHTIICGYGASAAVVAHEILSEGQGVVVIERTRRLSMKWPVGHTPCTRRRHQDDVLLTAGLGGPSLW